jgi:transposase-like protein
VAVSCTNINCANYGDTDPDLYRVRHKYTLKDGRVAYKYICRECKKVFVERKTDGSGKVRKTVPEQDIEDINRLRKAMGMPLIKPIKNKCSVCDKEFTSMLKTPWCEYCRVNHIKHLEGGMGD